MTSRPTTETDYKYRDILKFYNSKGLKQKGCECQSKRIRFFRGNLVTKVMTF